MSGTGQLDEAAARAAEDARRDRRNTRFAFVGLMVLLIGLYAAAVVLSGDDLPAGTTVAGVDVGGLSTDEAENVLRTELLPWSRRPVLLAADDRTFRLDPDTAGLSVDVAATVERAHGGARIDPRRLWADLTATFGPVEPVVRVDQDALIEAMHGIADRVDEPAVEPAIDFAAQRPDPRPPADGLALDTGGSIVALLDGWLASGGPAGGQAGEQAGASIELPVVPVPPQVGNRGLQQAIRELARPAMAAPVRLLVGHRTFEVPPARYAPALRYVVVRGALTPVVDAARLAQEVPRVLAAGQRAPQDAVVTLRADSGGAAPAVAPGVVPARNGVRTEPGDLADALVTALERRDRSSRVGGTPVSADLTTTEVRGWGIAEPVAAASVPYGGTGLGRLAARLNGTVVRPGGTLSLAGRLGPAARRPAGSRRAPDASPLATALLDAAFTAGMDVAERHHLRYHDPRLPRGLDAVLRPPRADLRLRATTPYGLLVQSWVSPERPGPAGSVGVRLWSTAWWTVTTRTSRATDVVAPGRRVGRGPACRPRSGRPGFTVAVARDLLHGERTRRTVLRSTYAPLDAVVCRR